VNTVCQPNTSLIGPDSNNRLHLWCGDINLCLAIHLLLLQKNNEMKNVTFQMSHAIGLWQ